MSGWLLVNEDGTLAKGVDAARLDLVPSAGDGQYWVRVPEPASDWALDDNGEPVLRSLVLTAAQALIEAKASRWRAAKAIREMKMAGGCETPLGRADTDADSQRKVNGAVTAALVARVAGVPFQPMAWTMQDNRVVLHDTDALVALGLAIGGHVDACQQAGTAIRAAIEAAETVEAVAAVDITAGYPA
ncbi:MAG: DUF4376 domain-containing protein [Sphingomonas fennica]